MKPQRLERLILLLRLLQTGQSYNKDALATECGVSVRTIFRDLNILKMVGIPLTYNETQGYSVHGVRLLPSPHLTIDEVLSLLFLGREMMGQLPRPCFAAARRAILKLESSLPLPLLNEVNESSRGLQACGTRVNPQENAEVIYETLVQAKLSRRIVRIEYRSPSERKTFTTNLRPYCLLFATRAWYVIGYSSQHREIRTFHIGRIGSWQVTNDTFEIPRKFSLESYLGNAWRMIPCGEDQVVRLRFSQKVARNVTEVQWHQTQRTSLHLDGRLEFEVTVAGLDEILWWILGYGCEVEVLEPEKLRQMVQWHIRRMLSMYQIDQEKK